MIQRSLQPSPARDRPRPWSTCAHQDGTSPCLAVVLRLRWGSRVGGQKRTLSRSFFEGLVIWVLAEWSGPRDLPRSAARRALQGAGGLSRTFSGAERNGHSRRVGRAARHCEINLKFSFPLHPLDLPALPSLHIPPAPLAPPPCVCLVPNFAKKLMNPQRVTRIFKKSTQKRCRI